MKKRGDVTIGTLVSIVLAIVVIAFLVYGFSAGWSNLWGKIQGFGGGESNVDDIALACSLACQQNSQYNYCEMERELITDDGKQGKVTCNLIKGDYGIEDCSDLCQRPEKINNYPTGESKW
jgi:hypothetical protein